MTADKTKWAACNIKSSLEQPGTVLCCCKQQHPMSPADTSAEKGRRIFGYLCEKLFCGITLNCLSSIFSGRTEKNSATLPEQNSWTVIWNLWCLLTFWNCFLSRRSAGGFNKQIWMMLCWCPRTVLSSKPFGLSGARAFCLCVHEDALWQPHKTSQTSLKKVTF